MLFHRANCMVMCFVLWTGLLSAAELPKQLPQEHAYQRVLRNYLAELRADDLAVTASSFGTTTDILASLDDDALCQAYLGWVGAVHQKARPTTLLLPSKLFTLAEIEGADGIRCYHAPEAAAWWLGFDAPGNPLAHQRGAKLRAMVMTMVNMIMLDAAHEHRWLGREFEYGPESLSGNMMQWADAYLHARDVLPEPVRAAFMTGFMKHFERMIAKAPRDVNTNMDMKEIIVLAQLDRIENTPETRRRMVREARRILFGSHELGPANSDGGKGTFHAAGYIGEMDGPETTYNGLALYHLLEAAVLTRGITEWDAFLPEVVDRMLDFKAHNTYPDPDGVYVGPSSWAKRTNDDYVRDQRARMWREFTAAMLSPHGLYLLRPTRHRSLTRTIMLPNREEMVAGIEKAMAALNRSHFTEKPAVADVPPFLRNASDWPDDTNYASAHYQHGTFARFKALEDGNAEPLAPPFSRPAPINRCFAGEFWVAKADGYGFQIETVPNIGRGYGNGALAGGSLAAFWTPKTGCVILGRLPAKWNNVTWATVDMWTTHHLWGRNGQGDAFSSARHRTPVVSYDNVDSPNKVAVSGRMGPAGSARCAMPGVIRGEVEYKRVFERTPQGLRVTSTLLSDGKDSMNELWESLPIYLRDGRLQAEVSDTVIEFLGGDGWRLAVPAAVTEPAGGGEEDQEFELDEDMRPLEPGTLVEGVRSVRLQRFGHHVRIDFDKPRRLKVGADLWPGAYQSKSRVRMLHIDLKADAAEDSPMPESTSVAYLIRQVE